MMNVDLNKLPVLESMIMNYICNSMSDNGIPVMLARYIVGNVYGRFCEMAMNENLLRQVEKPEKPAGDVMPQNGSGTVTSIEDLKKKLETELPVPCKVNIVRPETEG